MQTRNRVDIIKLKDEVQAIANKARTIGALALYEVLRKALDVQVGSIGRYNPHRAIPKRCPCCLGKSKDVLQVKADDTGYECIDCGYEGDGWTS
jgi:hypothetical protein